MAWRNIDERPESESFTDLEIASESVAAEFEREDISHLDSFRLRKDQALFNDELKTAFRNAVEKMVDDGDYLDLVRIHMDMTHNMHGSMGATGLFGFSSGIGAI